MYSIRYSHREDALVFEEKKKTKRLIAGFGGNAGEEVGGPFANEQARGGWQAGG